MWNISCFLFPLLFLSGNQCCDSLVSPCSESSSSIAALLPCQAADQSRLFALLVSLLVWHGQGSRHTVVFANEGCSWLDTSQGNHLVCENADMVIFVSLLEASHCTTCTTSTLMQWLCSYHGLSVWSCCLTWQWTLIQTCPLWLCYLCRSQWYGPAVSFKECLCFCLDIFSWSFEAFSAYFLQVDSQQG